MIEHLAIRVDDLEQASAWYAALLAPLGYEVTRRPRAQDDSPRVAFGRDRRAALWLVEGEAHAGLTIAVSADDAALAFAPTCDPAGNRIVTVAGGSGAG